MDYDKMRLWVAALRSGKYSQGIGALSKAGDYCCLGVACEVAIEHGLAVTKDRNVNGELGYDGETAFLPQSVTDWFGMKSSEGSYNNPKYDEDYDAPPIVELHEHNDNDHMSFDEIADIIEINWRLL